MKTWTMKMSFCCITKKLGIVMFVIFVGLYQQGYCRGGYNGGIMAVIWFVSSTYSNTLAPMFSLIYTSSSSLGKELIKFTTKIWG